MILRKFNKKGDANDANIPAVMLYYMMVSIILVILIFGFASLLTGWQQQVIKFPLEFKGEVIAQRFTQNVDCFAYSNEVTKVVYPGVIDLSKITKEQIESCYNAGEDGQEFFQFEIYLPSYDLRVYTDDYFNLVDHTIRKQLLVYDNGKFVPTTMFIYVQEKI